MQKNTEAGAQMTKRKQAYINMFRNEKYDRLEVILPKGTKERVKQQAQAAGMSTSEYIAELVAADVSGCCGRIAKKRQFTDEQRQLLKKWQVPAKYHGMIEALEVETDDARKAKAKEGQRVACCTYTVYLKAGYINRETGGRVIRTDKTHELRRLIALSERI